MESVEQRGRDRVRTLRRGFPTPPGIQQSPTGRRRSGASCLDKVQRFPGDWRICRDPGCVWSPESTSYHNRPESPLVTHLLLLPKACGLSCLMGGQEFPQGPSLPRDLCGGSLFFRNEASLCASVPALGYSKSRPPHHNSNYKKMTTSFTRSIVLVSSESGLSSYTQQEHLTLRAPDMSSHQQQPVRSWSRNIKAFPSGG